MMINERRRAMGVTGKLMIALSGVSLLLAGPVAAQLGGNMQDAAKVLTGMPPDMLAKVQSLAQILQQGIKDGKLTDEEVKRGMMSGQLAEQLKQLSPEAGQVLSEISEASKNGKGPGEDSLLPLLGGLGITPN
jgi:hypothetical protein